MSTVSVSTPDHLWRAFIASGIPARNQANNAFFTIPITNSGAR